MKDESTSRYPCEQHPRGGKCSSMDHHFCVSKQGVGVSPTSPPLKGPQLAVETEEMGYGYTIGDINCPQDVT